MSKKAAAAVRGREVASKGGRKVKEVETVARDSKTGRLTTKADAKARPAETTVEKVSRKAPAKKFQIPKSFGAVADLLYTTREKRLAVQKEVKELEDQEKILKAHLIDNLSKKDSTGAAGHIARAQIVTEDAPHVTDWDQLYKHIKKTGQFELLNRALNGGSVKERWANKKEVPGVEHFQVVKVSVTKVGR